MLVSVHSINVRFFFRSGSVQCGVEADIVVIMDASTSISKEEFREMKDFVKHLLSGFEIGPDHVRVGLASYNYDAVMEFHLNSFSTKYKVLQAVDAVSGQGADTRTDKALKLVREVMFTEDNGNRPNVPDVAIVITDGRSRDREETIEEAIKTHKDGITVFAIGVGSRISETELYAIASSPPDQFVFEVKDFQGLSAIETTLQRKTCGGTYIVYSVLLSAIHIFRQFLFMQDNPFVLVGKFLYLHKLVHDLLWNGECKRHHNQSA